MSAARTPIKATPRKSCPLVIISVSINNPNHVTAFCACRRFYCNLSCSFAHVPRRGLMLWHVDVR